MNERQTTQERPFTIDDELWLRAHPDQSTLNAEGIHPVRPIETDQRTLMMTAFLSVIGRRRRSHIDFAQ